ncbi:MAG: TRAP transporter small permease [Rhodobacteraceae bacterium]|nr:TRAP transporter small permease [Paracoccaceae bacterium]MCF8512891.1 TRAP transporter small permease [Paracoccaceae bacterium]MCF8517136.1 TRAP transporter small permease [Paracoccaceae bacterium]
MQKQSVWLGPLRGPVHKIMLFSIAMAVVSCGWLIFASAFLGSDIGMNQMLRPEDNLSARLALWALSAALLSASVYLSDTVGQIEPEPRGFFDILSLICGRLAMIGIVFVVLIMFYEVILRYVFEKPTLWANEFSLWLAGFIFLLAGLYAMQQRSHIRIYVIYDLMPRWAKKTADVISVALICAFAFALIWGGFNEAWDKMLRWETFGTAWDPPLPATMKPAILATIFLVALQAVSNLILDWNTEPESHSPMDDIDQTEIENIRRTLEGK